MAWTLPSLDDLRGRTLRYVRISVTDRCQFRCPYCRPEHGETPCEPKEDYLLPQEIARVVRILSTFGIRTVRFTGGEPLLRRDLHTIIEAIHTAGLDDLALTTNGALLTAQRAKELREAGLKRINISLDTLNPDLFRSLSGGAPIEPVLQSLDHAIDAGMRLKTNTVVVRDRNDKEMISSVL